MVARVPRLIFVAASAWGLAAAPPPLASGSQEPVLYELSGMVREASSGVALPQAFVTLERLEKEGVAGERFTVRQGFANGSGRFRFLGLPEGRYGLTVHAFGYAPWSREVSVPPSVRVDVDLTAAPFMFDTLSVDVRRIQLEGSVHTLREAIPLTRAEVMEGGGRVTRTDVLGRFRFTEVLALYPIRLRAAAFGYMPKDTLLSNGASSLPPVILELQEDAVVSNRIQAELDRIEERAASRRTALIPPLTREDFLRFGSRRTAMEVVRLRVPPRWVNRVGCVILDEEVQPRGLDSLERFMSDELEFVEFLRMPGLMVRVYTRDFFRSRMGSPEPLRRPVYAPGGNCR